VPGVKDGRWYFEQLWVNGERATRARTPNQLYYYDEASEAGHRPLTGKEADLSSQAIAGHPEDLAPVFRVSSNLLSDVTAVVYHSWKFRGIEWQALTSRRNADHKPRSALGVFHWEAQRATTEKLREPSTLRRVVSRPRRTLSYLRARRRYDPGPGGGTDGRRLVYFKGDTNGPVQHSRCAD
jgi:hypothetical protein